MNNCKLRGGGRVSPALCCLLLALAALLSLPQLAHADHPNDTSVTASLGERPSELEGVTVQVQDTQGPQLVVENTTDETLEVHDAAGVPFLRIGPGGVEANRKATTFYETYGPEGTLVPEEAREATDEEANASPEWEQVSERRSWGWFDHRLETQEVEVPEEVSHAGEAADFGEWEVPVRLGDTETSLGGSYRYEPSPDGTYVASLTSEPELPQVETQLSQGYGGATALLVQNGGEQPVNVLDGDGEPAIEIGPEEVRVNVSSPVGREANRGASAGATGTTSGSGRGAKGGGAQWETAAGGSSFTWQDSRLRPPDGRSGPLDTDAARWEIPLESSGGRSSVEGVIEWEPLEGEPTGGSGDSSAEAEESGHNHSEHDHSEHDHGSGGDTHQEEDTGSIDGENAASVGAFGGDSALLYGSIGALALGVVALGVTLAKRR